MKANPLLALSPALRRSRIGNIATAAAPTNTTTTSTTPTTRTKGILRRTRLEDRVRVGFLSEENYHISRGVTLTTLTPTTTTATGSSTGSSTLYKARSDPPSFSCSPLLGFLNGRKRRDQTQTAAPRGQSRNPFSTMAAAAPGPDTGIASTSSCKDGSVAKPVTESTTSTSTVKETEPPLPKLSPAEFQEYNQMAELMELYHNHFRHTWNMLYKTCTTGSRPNGMSLRSFLNQGLQLCRSLTMHHTIEERYFFPPLAERMPAFAENEHLITQHERIHEGIVRLEAYLGECSSGVRELRMAELKDVLDSFGEVLWAHLDDEVRMLGAENMRRYWTKEEVSALNVH